MFVFLNWEEIPLRLELVFSLEILPFIIEPLQLHFVEFDLFLDVISLLLQPWNIDLVLHLLNAFDFIFELVNFQLFPLNFFPDILLILDFFPGLLQFDFVAILPLSFNIEFCLELLVVLVPSQNALLLNVASS